MSLTQLISPYPIEVLGKGRGLAIMVIDYGPEHSLIWVTIIDETGEVWCARNELVRFRPNWTLGASRKAAAQNPLAGRSAVEEHSASDRTKPRRRYRKGQANGASPKRKGLDA
jgi:hypothetical protein